MGPATPSVARPIPSGPASGPAPSAPFNMAPQATRPAAPNVAPVPSVGTNGPARGTDPRAQSAAAATLRGTARPLLPFETIRFEGETDARSWAFFLTQDEAASGSSLSVGYQNAVVVMPEASNLRVVINGETVTEIPIVSSQGVKRVVVPVRAGLLRTGQNIIHMEAIQRHRTDCTVKATYELWTEVDAASTSLMFTEGAPRTLRSLEDLPAIGFDNAGVTTIRVVAPRIYRPEIRDRLLRLVQLVALRGRYAHPVIQVLETDPGPSPVGTLKVVMGIASELRGFTPAVPDAASIQPLALMMQDPGSTAPYLLVSGPTWNDLDNAINIVGGQGLNGAASRGTVDTASWLWPETPTVLGGRAIRFSDLGIPTQEFSGRRLRARFAINLPSDFYATDYGEATLYLDAAHTSAVQPGSHVDIYVNDRISATMTITSRGNIFRRHPIRIPMRNFKPGINHISFETILLTAADDRCVPGETLSDTSRFALFDTTSFYIPTYGRIGRTPDLSTLSTGSFPYGDAPVAVVLSRQDAPNYSAAGTLLARMARDGNAPVRGYFVNAASAADISVLHVGAVDQLPSGLLGRVNLSDNLRSVWQSSPSPNWSYPAGSRSETTARPSTKAPTAMPIGRAAAETAEQPSTDEIRRRWSETLQKRGVLQQSLESFTTWIENTFNLSVAKLTYEDKKDRPYEPPQRSSLLLAQSLSEGSGTRTLVTARTEEALAEEMARLTAPMIWSQMSGRAASLDSIENKLEIEPVDSFTFVQTQPLSFTNVRLVAANWMSINILQYAVLLVACCILLGISTYLLLGRLGRN
ncbi:cellulose biosynthesis cyclic di-GMP-binding regulatory protein BcsB [Microvirga puerhi]|uniref:Cyclic di-GMP-binding protein n=1 Tax=Microvirga puerhi TaxID=2876078 RepID=A0ABS7VRT4_9HYPH|nr:cellulose biosynthesis cyclic di-GMP-binding regulatory protein BcsB [Microvirga puerhi]MBZ6077775.1 cellulose biosynthesis cyclic di-GMP-binding regulatory protein BcsB [Microvirga puerhi]